MLVLKTAMLAVCMMMGAAVYGKDSVTQKLSIQVSQNFGRTPKAKYRIMIASHPAAYGEKQAAIRLATAIGNLGWEWAIVDRPDLQPESMHTIQPDFVISLREEITPQTKSVPHFLYLHVPMFMYLDKGGVLSIKGYPNVLKYDGFLHVVPDATPVKVAFEQKYKTPYRFVNTVFSIPHRPFNPAPKQRLCYWGTTWDKARGSDAYQRFYALLDGTNYFQLYGPQRSWGKFNLRNYKGEIPLDDHSVVDKISDCGIALVLHSHEHIRGGVPTSRIFEAAAASAVIICDEHPFVKKHFGDAVLYINPKLSPAAVFQQIDAHVKWIRANPGKAIALARRAHQIFARQFTLEGELKKVAGFYEQYFKR